ncbi:hypothetical protein KGY14_02005 [Ameyamaea chiangmaiensis]|uniref:Uncharacterized protein n=2 Tax=Ameyamaea chiangmaiensis TaxID=442969 RepID=A0A850P8B4_9PROT|nr:hypothetical protein [Ameyamaea chiangmaiensis]NVN40837.1 hypothetical protein [Ameyamaea chiangmaiensis]
MLETPEPDRRPDPQGAPPVRRAMFYGMIGVIAVAGLTRGLSAHHDAVPAPQPAAQQAPATPALPGHALQAAGQFNLIQPDRAAQALARTALPPDQKAEILAGIARRDYRLVEMPIYDNAGTGGIVSVRSGGISQQVALSSTKPTTVVLPIRISGEVDILPVSDPGLSGISPGAITSLGPTALPTIHKDEYLVLDVIAQ